MPHVYIVNDSGHDYSAAEQFGSLVRLSYGPVNKYDATAMLRTLVPALEGSRPEDYIIHSGPTIMFTLACTLFALKHRRLNLLVYTGQYYRARVVDLAHIEEWSM